MYRVDRNNFYKNEKKSTIYTPIELSEFLFSILDEIIEKPGLVLDPCVGEGSLLKPFFKGGYNVMGIDIEDQGFEYTKVENYLAMNTGEIENPTLIIMNPPFNIDGKNKEYIKKNYWGRPLLPEVFLSKTVDLFGKNIPIVMITPYGFRLNQTCKSKRWVKFRNREYPEISSIISLPKNIFDGILFHSEVLIFNIKGLKGHYFFNEIKGGVKC